MKTKILNMYLQVYNERHFSNDSKATIIFHDTGVAQLIFDETVLGNFDLNTEDGETEFMEYLQYH